MNKWMMALLLSFPLYAQEGMLPTQVLVTVESKDVKNLVPTDLTIEANRRKQSPTRLDRVAPNGTQIALLIDDGLRESVGREIDTLRSFVANLQPGTEVLVGYMRNGAVMGESVFTTDHAAAAARVRLPLGSAGVSASPYFCLSEFVKRWPTEGLDRGPRRVRARFVMMITNGVDPYNGSTSILNQDSPYVTAAVADAQRAGVIVSSIYFSNAGMRGERASFSGQSYLSQVAEGTGGRAYYQGMGNPVSLSPFLSQFQHDISETYIATFAAGGREIVDLKVRSNVPHLKVRAAQGVRAGNLETNQTR